MSIAARFALAMTIALAVVMMAAGYLLFNKTQQVVDTSVDQSMAAATRAGAIRSARSIDGVRARQPATCRPAA